jgi:hypothetical protein
MRLGRIGFDMEIQMNSGSTSQKPTRARVIHRVLWLIGVIVCAIAPGLLSAAPVLYQTGFETSEGYDTNLDLVGQKGWVGQGSGGNGIVSGWFTGRGQQAYIGFSSPNTNDSSLFIYQPINKTVPQAQFSVTMQIEDSSNGNWDDFYWSAFNQQGQELFTLDFDNFELKLYYFLGGSNDRISSGLSFTNGVAYQLKVGMDFTANSWNATLNGALIATNKTLTTNGAALNLGDIDAAWSIPVTNRPGNNFMIFDDYQVKASIPAPQIKILGVLNGAPTLRVLGLADNRFAMEASTNLTSWLALKTNTTTAGSFDFVDDKATNLNRRFYRVRWVP